MMPFAEQALLEVAVEFGVLTREQAFSADKDGYQNLSPMSPAAAAGWAATHLSILDKAGRLVPLHYNAAQRDYLAKRTRRDLILKARQLGFSTVIQAELFRECVTGTAITMTLSHEDETTQKFRRMVNRFYQQMPDPPARKYANARLATYPATHSEAVIATAGNRNTGRGGTYTALHGSEVAYWPDAESIMAGAMQGGNPRIVLESTPNGAQGYFYQLCMEARDGRNDFALHFYPWWYDPAYALPLAEGETLSYSDDELALLARQPLSPEQIKWRRLKQIELKHLFVQEYPEDPVTCFLQSGFGYFGDISGCFTAPFGAMPDGSHRYTGGLDFGQTTDYTALDIIDSLTGCEVDLLRLNRLPWAEMRRQVVSKCKHWGISTLLGEANSMGSTNTEELRKELGAAGCTTSLVDFQTSNDSKAMVMSALHEGLHSGALRLLDIPESRHEMNAFAAQQLLSGAWRLAARNGEHDDIVIARALAWHAGHMGQGIWF